MTFENKTIDEIYNLAVTGFEEEFNARFRLLPKSFVRVLCKVFAGIYITLYKACAWGFLQIFPSTAQFGLVSLLGKKINPLAEWGNLLGCDPPKAAVAWAGNAEVSVLADGVIQSGTQLMSPLTQKVYLAAETTSVFAGTGTAELPVVCAEAGDAGGLNAGDELKFVNPLGFVAEDAAVLETTAECADAESEAEYRERVVSRWKSRPQGGALADYRNWASEVEGVWQTYVYSDDLSAAGVIIYVCASEEATGSRIASAALCKAVGRACTYDGEGKATRKPVAAVLDPAFDESYGNVRSITEKAFDVTVTGYTGEISTFREALKSQLETYFGEREPYVRGLASDDERLDGISRNALAGMASDVAAQYSADFGTLAVYSGGDEVASYTLGRGEMARLGTLTVEAAPDLRYPFR